MNSVFLIVLFSLLMSCKTLVNPDNGEFKGEAVFRNSATGYDISGKDKSCYGSPEYIQCESPSSENKDFIDKCKAQGGEVFSCECDSFICSVKV